MAALQVVNPRDGYHFVRYVADSPVKIDAWTAYRKKFKNDEIRLLLEEIGDMGERLVAVPMAVDEAGANDEKNWSNLESLPKKDVTAVVKYLKDTLATLKPPQQSQTADAVKQITGQNTTGAAIDVNPTPAEQAFDALKEMSDEQFNVFFNNFIGKQVDGEMKELDKSLTALSRSARVEGGVGAAENVVKRTKEKIKRDGASDMDTAMKRAKVDNVSALFSSAGFAVALRSPPGKASNFSPGCIVSDGTLLRWRRSAQKLAAVPRGQRVTPLSRAYIWSFPVGSRLNYIPTGYLPRKALDNLREGDGYPCEGIPYDRTKLAYVHGLPIFPSYIAS
jgi:hypothetical protein